MPVNHSRPSWQLLPVLAIALAASFIAWDAALMARTTGAQKKLGAHIEQLDRLSRLNTQIDQLVPAHVATLGDGGDKWNVQVAAIRGFMDHQLATLPDGVGLANLIKTLGKDLANCDSLHREARRSHTLSEATMADAVLTLMIRNMRGHVEDEVRQVQRNGLAAQTLVLDSQWTEAHGLLALASLLALLCAGLVTYVARLLVHANERSELLARTGEELERTNRNLRETMLSKEEKEVMLKEIHHRVKNNLQIVRSLIRFQMDKVREPHTTELFNECVNRVGAMALVHEQTYMSNDLANIDVANYLNSLLRDLVHAYNIRMKLHLDVDIQVGTLSVDTLTPLGLLINEVVSNSFKHAFHGRQEGTIILHLSGTEQGGLVLRIGDDGVGLSDADKWEKPNSLGMDLIHTLAGQLNASMAIAPGPGMVYQMTTVPDQEIRRRA